MLAWKEAVMSDKLRDARDGLEADFFRDYRIVSAGRTLTRRYLCSLDQDRRGDRASDSLGAPGAADDGAEALRGRRGGART